MDAAFHAISAGWLAHRLGERRRIHILMAVLIGILPDILAIILRECGWRYAYRWTHSLTFNLPLLFLLLWRQPRIAWGGLLHIGIDVITHGYATRWLLYPFAEVFIPIGLTLRHWPGQLLWLGLWVGLLALIRHEHLRTTSRLSDRQKSF